MVGVWEEANKAADRRDFKRFFKQDRSGIGMHSAAQAYQLVCGGMKNAKSRPGLVVSGFF